MPVLTLRPAADHDIAFAYAVTKDAMQRYVEQTWGMWDESRQRDMHAQSFVPATHRLLLVDDDPAGVIALHETHAHLALEKLYLLAAYRNCGYGADLIARIKGEALAVGKPVCLRVLRVNTAAQRFYARHGFRVTGATAERLVMECRTQGAD